MINFKQINDAPDYYVSNTGVIISRRIENKEKILKPHLNERTGYMQISLLVNDIGQPTKRKTYCIHKLVAQHFVDNPDNLHTVNHRDLNKENNHSFNLEWVTQCDNIHHYYKSNAINKPRNMRAVAVYTLEDDYIGTYPSINAAAKAVGVAASTPHQQLIGNTKRGRKFNFRYDDIS